MGYVDSRRKQESASGGMRLANGHGIVDPQTGSIVAWWSYTAGLLGVCGGIEILWVWAASMNLKGWPWMMIGVGMIFVSVIMAWICFSIQGKVEAVLQHNRAIEDERKRKFEEAEKARQKVEEEKKRKEEDERRRKENARAEAYYKANIREFYKWYDATGGTFPEPIDVPIPCKRGESYYYYCVASYGRYDSGKIYISNRRISFVGRNCVTIPLSSVIKVDISIMAHRLSIYTQNRVSSYDFETSSPCMCQAAICALSNRKIPLPRRID